ncbi:hypothetical protein JKP88DRAFT_253058 [Tribonema minus]|uniref:Uncharacterized protein n=1 Tax=Tribonema minus TaxID=303371 RepID=A0A835ZB60_9STRA|nr:hypothetical protein JKP88DRAFT_253058 [Tribonema minus]
MTLSLAAVFKPSGWRFIACSLLATLLWAPSIEAASGSSCSGCVTDQALKCVTYQCDNNITPTSVTVTLNNCLNLSFVAISYNGQCYKVGPAPLTFNIPCSSTSPLIFITHDGKKCNPNGGATAADVGSCYNNGINKNQLQGVCVKKYTAARDFTPCTTASGLTCPAPDLTETPTAQILKHAVWRCMVNSAADINTHEHAHKPANAVANKPANANTHKPADTIPHKPAYTHAHFTADLQPHLTAYLQPHRAAHN